ncbi:phosphate acyltransferase [Simiduia agarivorans SA1 = DSM 21679]|uniref:Phosphate acyltransferase n=2 Tax=Simiduia TaxID=447467 RepID=K4KVG1_SIMAS|nr:phosphate acyltransferase [Simiduia agarivorans SA1 = DSM 21679]
MGGDLGPRAVFRACEISLAQHPQLFFTIFFTPDALPLLPDQLRSHVRVQLVSDCASIDSDLKPTDILRHKSASLWRAVESVSLGQADACVSGGNTGALMVAGKRLLGMLPGIERPAICQRWPTRKGHTLVLDLGANVDVSPAQLCQFARMASVLSPAEAPSVALLNIGLESNKGGESIRAAAAALSAEPQIHFQGFIEANQLLDGNVDVVVTDGFTGNIALKASEGAALFLIEQLKAAFSGSWYGKLVGQLAKPVLLKWRTRFDPARYNGASFLGLSGQLIKSHGGADAAAFANALSVAIAQAESGFSTALAQHFSNPDSPNPVADPLADQIK